MALCSVIQRRKDGAREDVKLLKSKGKVDGEIKEMPPVGHYMAVSGGDFQVARYRSGWHNFAIVAENQAGAGWQTRYRGQDDGQRR